jgi:hypothetical protein
MQHNDSIIFHISQERADQIDAILRKYGKEEFDPKDLDISFDDATRLEELLTGVNYVRAQFYVAVARGLIDPNEPGNDY